MRPARANWAHGHTRSALDPGARLQAYPNTQSTLGEFSTQTLDRHALDPLHRPFRDHSRRREYPTETRLCPAVPVSLAPRLPDENKKGWLPFERQSEEERDFEDMLDELDARFGISAKCARRTRSTLRIARQGPEDTTNYEAFAEEEVKTDIFKVRNVSRFGDAATNLKKDRDALTKMESYFVNRLPPDPPERPGTPGSRPSSRPGSSRPGSRPGSSRPNSRNQPRPVSRGQQRAAEARQKYGGPRDEWDARMRRWMVGNSERIASVERENREYERRLSLRNSRLSRGSSRGSSSSLDAPRVVAARAPSPLEPRSTMAFIKS